ncbi:putative germin-like protein 2-1 isoform X2 [Morus notabilis]|uniref:putative germin-like protein 2-1 isoform X2 n=1 Tax=Morus notabilis TaxID=981085 RepID=UPI000CECEA4A|nr:putative germin-like protein 2-1 isoform X2 [Morus notabilis]
MESSRGLLMLGLFAMICSITFASEPSPLQDFCVADSNGPGTGLHIAGNTSNAVGSRVTAVNVAEIPGLNTLGISLARVDYAPWGINPPHTHPRATEILTVLEGTLEVGFVTSNPENRLIKKVVYKGDVFVFPIGLVHFQRNIGYGNAAAIAALSSQNPGVITVANAVFGSNPDISPNILAKAFQVDKNAVLNLQSKF